jgi:uncharacterized membrane protein YidH (DUF202 family)
MKSKFYPFLLLLLLTTATASSQPGLDDMQTIQQNLSQSFFSALDCSLVIAAIFGIIGAIRIYHNWQMGRERITEEVANWFYAALFMVLAGVFLRAVFGL